MSTAPVQPPPILPEPAPKPEKALRRLFLTLFLRGRSARGLKRQTVPKSVGEKLALTLLFYCLFGCMALLFWGKPVFALAIYLHAMTFVFLGMFVASSAGEILFNKEEADILMHRPVTSKALLWAKIRVLVEVSLWLAGAFNLAGLVAGFGGSANWRFPIIHLFSTTLEALFCTGCVVLVYQLCLRWFGRERLEGLMTMAQVIISVGAVLSGQILPRFVLQMNHVLNVNESSWWIYLLPPAWFAGMDDAFSGSALGGAWVLSALAVMVTGIVLWLAFDKLAGGYETGLQAINETISSKSKYGQRRWLDRLVTVPPLSWWLRDPVSRASFLLTAAYLVRDRDTKLRVYPGIAPVLIIPFIFVIQNTHADSHDAGFGVPFSGVYLGLVPLMGLQLLQYSQQWQATDIFRTAPLAGPANLCHGARRAVLCLLALPMMVLVALVVWLLNRDVTQLLLFTPGLVAMPIFALVPQMRGDGVPLSLSIDAAKSANRGLSMLGVMFVAFALAGLASFAWSHGWFGRFMGGEIIVASILYFFMRSKLSAEAWQPI